MTIEIALSLFENSRLNIYSDRNLFDSEYADDVVLLSAHLHKLQFFRHRLNDSAAMNGMRFSTLKCTMLLKDWTGSKLDLVLTGEHMNGVDKFNYLGSCISPVSRV